MSAISGAALTTSQLTDPVASSTPSRYSELNSEEFIRIIFTELQNQDPLQPSDTKALLEQLNSIRQIESDLELTSNIQSLVTENQLSTAGGLIGTYVTGRTNDFNPAEGWVVSAARRGDQIMLGLDDGSEVSLENLQEVVNPSAFPDRPDAP
ncbi:MAG: flagellar hook capping FlgD N-terminal domain-containing protein [Phycisphaerales bacterium]